MRLLNVHSLQLKEFTGRNIPKYCILSHRWGEEEVSFKEFRKGSVTSGEGYRKILEFCEFVKAFPAHIDGVSSKRLAVKVDWVWIDTCCIDKRSSSELSEAINSMYRWYADAAECFVYLQDVKNRPWDHLLTLQELRSSSWFTRGWTLQELLAPTIVIFCNASWDVIGHSSTKAWLTAQNGHYESSLSAEISDITKIPSEYLNGESNWKRAPIAQRMSWASDRQTTRIEDEAYCLLGIFGINMPLIYGEGRKAFLRLQEEIIRHSTDQSIFIWRSSSEYPPWAPILASSPKCFRTCMNECIRPPLSDRPYTTTNNGLEMRTTLWFFSKDHDYCYLILWDHTLGAEKAPFAQILLKRDHANFYYRFNERYKHNFVRGRTETQEDQLIYVATGREMTDAFLLT